MKIVYFYQYFSTSEGAWGTRVYEFTKRWVEQGHQVTVVTSIYSKSDLKRSGWLVESKVVDGIRLKVINVIIDNRQPVLKRMITFAQYALISSWYAVTLKADVVVASSGPITVGIPGLVAKWIRGRRLIFEARDLWPEGAIQMGLLKGRLPIALAYAFERICYRSSKFVVGLSPGIKEHIENRFSSVKVESVTNAANLTLFSTPNPYTGPWKARTFALYFGNIGLVNHSPYLLDTARLLLGKGRDDISIVLIGEGQLKADLQRQAKSDGLFNVHFLELMPKKMLVGYIQNALASVIPLRPDPVFDTSSPNKLFESMAAGVPVVQTTQGWIKEFITHHQVGFTVNAQKPSELADVLITLKDDPRLAHEMGERALAAARAYFDKDMLADKMLDVLKRVSHGD